MKTTVTFSRELGMQIRETRKKTKLSQAELARYAGVGKTVVYDIEHGKTSVQLNSLLKILHVLNMKITVISPVDREV